MTTVLVLAAAMVAAGANGRSDHVQKKTAEAELLRRYGYAMCLAKGYQGTPTGQDAERSADLYRQEGRANIESYEDVRRVAGALDPAKASVVDKHNFAIVACLEFYESRDLKTIIRKALARPHAFP
jgi:Type VI secretion system (T6SS), amidase immunity protein